MSSRVFLDRIVARLNAIDRPRQKRRQLIRASGAAECGGRAGITQKGLSRLHGGKPAETRLRRNRRVEAKRGIIRI